MKIHYSRHAGVLPDGQMVLGETVARDELAVVGRPNQLAYLGVGLSRGEACSSRGVPGSDGAVVCTSARSEGVGLEGAPGESLDCSGVVVERESGAGSIVRVDVPDVDQVVIASGGELVAIRRPLQSADLLGVTSKQADNMLLCANVVVDDVGVLATGAQDNYM